jgi:hypothetical protein
MPSNPRHAEAHFRWVMKKLNFLAVAICGLCLCEASGCGSGGPPPPPQATHLSVSGGTSTTVGMAFSITVSALTADGSVATSYSGTVHFTSSDAQAALPPDSALTNGSGTYQVTFKSAGKQTVTASDVGGRLSSGTTSSISVTPGTVAQFSVSTSSGSMTAGTSLSVTVTAEDAANNPVTSYTGTVHFMSTDAQAILPADSTLTNGTGNFSVTLKTSGSQTISATDKSTTSITGTSSPVAVSAGPAATLSVQAPAAVTTGIAFSVTVRALDTFSNVATSYSGTVHFTSNDPQAVLPANLALSSGQGNSLVTLKTIASNETVSATDTAMASIAGASSAINVVSNAATHLSVTGNPGSVVTRQTFNVTVTALDAANNQSSGYAGTVHFTSSDTGPTGAKLPADSPLAGGSASFSATFEDTGTGAQTITATDKANASITGASGSISVADASALAISTGAPPNGTVGVTYGKNTPAVQYEICRFSLGPHIVCSWEPSNPYPRCNFNLTNPPCWTGKTRTVYIFTGFRFQATGGVGKYMWSATNVPAGLTVDGPTGEILGTPTSPGTFNITATVTDSGNPAVQTTGNYSFTMAPPPAPVVNTSPAPPPGVVNQSYNYTFAASGYAPLTWSETGALPNGLAFNNSTGLLSGTPTATGSFPITVTATDQFKQSSPGASFTIMVSLHGFFAIGDSSSEGDFPTATLLGTAVSSKVLIAGGRLDSNNVSASANLFDPVSAGITTTAGAMISGRSAHTATLLATTGKVLLVGGQTGNAAAVTNTAELYDPMAGTFASTGSMQTARSGHAAVALGAGGKVLVIGGTDASGKALASAELYDASLGTFTATGSMHTARTAFTATVLVNGKVLVAGGVDAGSKHLSSAELYDPSTGTFTAVVGIMTVTRASHTATLLNDAAGTVLLAGGVDDTGKARNSAELFNPATGSFSATSNMGTEHSDHTATLLPDGTVLIAGGIDGTGNATASAELFNLTAGSFASTGSLVTARERHTATLLNDGRVLVTGGSNSGAVASAELYQ